MLFVFLLDIMAKKKKTAVVIGYGGMGSHWGRSITKHPDWDLIGAIDTDTELLENIHSISKGVLDDDQIATSIEEFSRFVEKPDMAVVATPIYSHHSIVRETMNLGIHVICEKNMASTIYQGRQMVQKALDHPELMTAVDTQRRYSTRAWTAKKFFLQGDEEAKDVSIGKLGMIKFDDNSYRGEKRWGWRRFLQEIYLEDMSVHWFDMLRYVTGMDIIQVKADTFMPRYSDWHGSSEVFVQFAMAAPENYNHRHEWVWCQLYGGWQRRGPTGKTVKFFGADGQAELSGWGIECKLYTDPNDSRKFEKNGYLPKHDIENLGTNYEKHGIILEYFSQGIEDGETECGLNFKEAFKSFAVAMAAKESSRTGKAVWVPKYWKDIPWYEDNPSRFY